MGRKESARFRRRRQAWWEVQSGAGTRQAPDAETQADFVTAIDKKQSQQFGIGRLAKLELDGGVPVAAWVSRTNSDGTLSLLRYASLRGRDRIVGMMLRGGAASLGRWACDGETVDIEPLKLLPVQEASQCLVLAARFAEASPGDGFVWSRLEEAKRKRWWVGCGCVVSGADLFAHLAVRRPYGAIVPCPACGGGEVAAPVVRARELDADTSGMASDARQRFVRLSDKIRSRITDALFAAARRGDIARLKRMLIGDGCDVDALDEQGCTAALTACLSGQAAFLEVLRAAGADLERSSAVAPPHGAVAAVDAARLECGPAPADLRVEERVPGVFYVRDCCSGAEIESLARLHASLPVAKSAKLQCGLERRHFVDAHRWLDAIFRRALPAARVAPRCKFVEYVRADSEMAPHVDLSKPASDCLDASVAATTHTWVLYLRTCVNGGATAMLGDVRDKSSVLDEVYPEGGALLVFPHRQPHAGCPTCATDPKKLIARGELLFVEDV